VPGETLTDQVVSSSRWMERGACRQEDPESFFPAPGTAAAESHQACQSCLVRAECLEYALTTDQRFGI